MSTPVSITSCYAFFPLEQNALADLREELLQFGKARGMKGHTLIATEGINGTVCGSTEAIDEWKKRLRKLSPGIIFKDSEAEGLVFKRWLVKIKPEIVALKKDVHPHGSHKHLSPEAWNEMLKEDVVVLDARNGYEVDVGRFKNAINPKIRHFHQFPEYVKKSGIPKDKKVMMYCTGGIRCEKALLEMEAQGYQNVYQLEGGILAYLEKFPNQNFEGECFVFDHRVAVDQELKPSKTYELCACCGDPVVRTR